MLILAIMCAGVLIGIRFFKDKYAKPNYILQVACTSVLIFSMGVSLGAREDFLSEIAALGLDSLIFAAVPIIFSVAAVYLITRKWKQ